MKNVTSDIAYDYLRKRILSGEYAPGAALMTNMLAPEIGVSRTPIRDALRQLEADGLVTIQPRLGASVKKMDVKAFRESCELRLALESHAAGRAARNRTDVDLHEIGLALEEMRRITVEILRGGAAGRLISALVREDVRFHLAIITAAKNDLIKKEILRLHLVNRVVSGPTSEVATKKARRRTRTCRIVGKSWRVTKKFTERSPRARWRRRNGRWKITFRTSSIGACIVWPGPMPRT